MDDLLGVIALYATTKVTFSLLAFIPSQAYEGSHLWRRKALKEAKGLVVNDDVVGTEWYAYYLMRNRTYYGDVLTMRSQSRGCGKAPSYTSKTTESAVIFHYSGINERTITQHASYEVTLRSHFIPSRGKRKIRQVLDITSGYYLLDEYGDVWSLTIRGDSIALSVTPIATDVVALVGYEQFVTRDGRDTGDESVECKVVEATSDSVLGVDGVIHLMPPIGEYKTYRDVFLTLYIKNTLTPVFGRFADTEIRTISVNGGALLRSDRSVIVGTATAPSELPYTKGRTQTAGPLHWTGDVWVLIDPSYSSL